jgi:hypothetical protein
MATLRHFVPYLVATLITLFSCFPAFGSMTLPTHDWSVVGPGGIYGLVENEFVTLSGQHVGHETWVLCGPIQLDFPFRLPTTIAILVAACAVASRFGYVVFLRLRKHGCRKEYDA